MSEATPATLWAGWTPRLLSVLRIAAGFLVLWPGSVKLFGSPVPMPTGGAAVFGSALWFGGLIEFVGGLLMLFGRWTRPVALLLAVLMAVNYLQFHAPRGWWPVQNGGTAAALFAAVFLYLSAAGGGPWSLDARRPRDPRGARGWRALFAAAFALLVAAGGTGASPLESGGRSGPAPFPYPVERTRLESITRQRGHAPRRAYTPRMLCRVSLAREGAEIVARCPEYPECAGRGRSREVALESLRASVLFWLEACPCDVTADSGLRLDVVHEAP
jgi:putative oxidoreductase